MSSRANYGIDSPAIVAGLFVLGGLAFSTALVWRLFGDPPLFGQIALVGTGAYFLLTAVGMVSYSKAGKLRVRDQILESTPWRGDERVLDCCGRWLACSSRGDDWRWWISFSQASASGCYRESASPMPCGVCWIILLLLVGCGSQFRPRTDLPGHGCKPPMRAPKNAQEGKSETVDHSCQTNG